MELDASALVGGALTLTAALAWNDAARKGIDLLYPKSPGATFGASLTYAVVVTLLVAIIIFVFKGVAAGAARAENELGVGEGYRRAPRRARP